MWGCCLKLEVWQGKGNEGFAQMLECLEAPDCHLPLLSISTGNKPQPTHSRPPLLLFNHVSAIRDHKLDFNKKGFFIAN